jgi:MFS family permease
MKVPNLIDSFSEGLRLDRKSILAFLLLYFASANWYTVITKMLLSSVEGASFTWVSFGFDFLIALSMLAGGLLIKNRNRLEFLRISAILCIALTLVFPLATTSDSVTLLIILLGVPGGSASLALAILFAERTSPKERGRLSGAMVAFSIFTSPALIALCSEFGLAWTLGTLVFLNFIVVVLSFAVPDLAQNQATKQTGLGFGRNYLLYLVAWIFVSLVNGFFSPILNVYYKVSFQQTMQFGPVLEYVAACVSSLVGGYLMDWYGRKPFLLLGIALFGVSASLTALASNSITLSLIWISSGCVWGMFLSTFYLFIWSEATTGEASAFAYSLGLMIFHMTRSLGSLTAPYPSQFNITELALMSSGLLFLGALPLMAAQETLPSEERQALRFTRYLRKLREEVER